jgi:hypothetical protein
MKSNHNIQTLTEFGFSSQKPMMQYRNAIGSMQAMLDVLTGVRKIRQHIPVREAISGVVNERREFVRGCPFHWSSIGISDARGRTLS